MLLAAGLALTLCISPPMLDINLVRLDYLIMLPVIVLFSGGLALARRKETTFDAVALGVALAFASTFKLTGGIFAIFIAIGLIVRLCLGPFGIRRQHILCFAGSFLLIFVPLMFRYWAYLSVPEIAAVLWGGVGSVAQWDFFDQPASYYAVTLFMAHGLDFVILYLAASAFVVGLAVIRRDETSLYLAIAFLLFSALGLVVMRYERGGYHLLPLYLANVGLTITTLWRIAPPRLLPKAVAAIAAAVVAISLVPAGIHYLQVIRDMKSRVAAVDETLGASLEWLRTHVAAGSRVCIYKDAYWSGPPISRLPVTLVDTAFAFPYLDRVEMANFAFPSLATIHAECEEVVLSGFYTGFFRPCFAGHGARASRPLAPSRRGDASGLSARDIPAPTAHFIRLQRHAHRGFRPAVTEQPDDGPRLGSLCASLRRVRDNKRRSALIRAGITPPGSAPAALHPCRKGRARLPPAGPYRDRRPAW